MPLRHYFVGDDAYSASRQMGVPFSGSHGFRSPKDNFNFFQSSTRINIECAFGILVRRWGVLWRRQEGSLQRINSIVMACLICHNLCIDARLGGDIETVQGARNPIDPRAGQFASCPDGYYETRDGAFVANPNLHGQDQCSTEGVSFSAISSCPHRSVLCDYIALQKAKRPEHRKRKAQPEF